jgi:LacI family transcriptional regulator
MQADPAPTAVLCGNDVLAIGALAKAREMGLAVPEDVSITGFDDLEIARFTSPPMTTVRAPHQEMGREAAKMLVQMVNGEAPDQREPLETTISLRGTLAPPKV